MRGAAPTAPSASIVGGVDDAPGIDLVRLSADAVLPRRTHPTDAGLDLTAVAGVRLAPGERAPIQTGWAVGRIAPGWAALVMPCSGLAARHGITLANAVGLVDAGYRGPLVVLLANHGAEPVELRAGERIAQLVLVPVGLGPAVEVAAGAASDGRGSGGFGSSGRS